MVLLSRCLEGVEGSGRDRSPQRAQGFTEDHASLKSKIPTLSRRKRETRVGQPCFGDGSTSGVYLGLLPWLLAGGSAD